MHKLRIRVVGTTPPKTTADVERLVDASIDEFNEYFQTDLKNEPLVRAERAIIKTYLYFLLHKTD